MDTHLSAEAAQPQFIFVANLLWLDLVNTEPVVGGRRIDLLPDPAGLERWMRAASQASGERTSPWDGVWGAASPSRAAWREALALRSALREMAGQLVAGSPAGARPLEAVNRVLASQPRYPQLVRRGGGYATELHSQKRSSLAGLLPVAESAAWLLEHGDTSLLRRCEGPDCVLYFYDTTRNKSRRWCSMGGCGGRAKALAYYRRQHGKR